MTREEYISSGILEAYLLDELTPREVQEVEQMLQMDPSLYEELDKIEDTLFALSEVGKKQLPNPDLKQQLIDLAGTGDEVVNSDESTLNSGVWKYLVAASVTLFILSSTVAYNYWEKWRTANDEVIALRSNNERLAQDLQQVNNSYADLNDDFRFLSESGTKQVTIKGLPVAPNSSAIVYWNPDNQKVLFKVNDLPAPPIGKQYQLWAIVDGKPTDLGVFDLDTDFLTMKNVSNAAAFAVTLEKEGGSPVPTLEAMYLLGEVS